ncbi:MAG: PAS domain S-box protein [Chloroflexi bacterium]|nr:PAS domain S-box protein [Chloroflexota bacterium]
MDAKERTKAELITELEALRKENTQLKRGLEENRNALLLRNMLIDIVEHPIFSIDSAYKYTAFNSAHAKAMKAIYDVDIEIGKNLLECMHVLDDRARAKKNLDKALAGEQLILQSFAGDKNVDRRFYEISHIPIPKGVMVLAQDITELEYANDELKKLSKAVEYSPASIVITDASGSIEYVNPKFCELTGYSLAESIGQNPRILKTEFTPPETFSEMWEAISSGKEWRGEFINRKKNGDLYYELASISPILDTQGEMINFVAVKEDITKRKEAEEDLRSHQASLTALIENTNDDIWSIDSNYQITTLNSNFQEHFVAAFATTLEIGDNIIGILREISAELTKVWQERYNRALQGEHFTVVDSFDYEGVPQYVEAAFNPISINDHIVGISVFAKDITERTLIGKALQKSEEHFRMIAENTGDVIWMYDISAEKFTYISPAAQSLRGYSPEEVRLQSIEDVLSPESYRYIRHELPRRLAAYKSGDDTEYVRTENLGETHKAGHIIHTEVVTTLLADDDRNTYAVLGVSRDITQRKKAEDALVAANTALQIHLSKIEALQGKLREQALRDSITGLYNRHYMREALEREISQAKRKKWPIGLIMIDIDHFKQVNDTFGHLVGDLALQNLGTLIHDNIRSSDIPCRYGGDELLIIMPDTSLEIAHERAELIRSKFESIRIPYKSKTIQVTLSIGVASYSDAETSDYEGMLNAVDEMLYKAKSEGRNRVFSIN